MLERLEQVDVASLSERQRIDFAVAVEKCLRRVEGLRLRAVAAAAGARAMDPARDAGVLTLAGQLRVSPTQAGHQVAFAREMVTAFADTLARVENGAIPLAHARALYAETVGLTVAQSRAVEVAVLGKAATRTPYQHTAAIRRAVKRVAPRPRPEVPGSPESERRADVREAGPWRLGVWAEGPVEQMAVLASYLAATAHVPKDPEETRTIGQRRFDALIDLVSAKTSVFVDLVGYVNPDGTISLPGLPGVGELSAEELSRVVAGGSVRFHNPDRKPPATDAYAWTEAQRRYCSARDRTCRFPGCGVAAQRCELDHIRPFSAGGATDVDNGICLCKRHHRVKHQPDWKIRRFDDNTVRWTGPTGHITTAQPWTSLRT